MQPSVSLQKTPGGCNLKYTSSDVIQVSAAQIHAPSLSSVQSLLRRTHSSKAMAKDESPLLLNHCITRLPYRISRPPRKGGLK